jgi:hypothetical protein
VPVAVGIADTPGALGARLLTSLDASLDPEAGAYAARACVLQHFGMFHAKAVSCICSKLYHSHVCYQHAKRLTVTDAAIGLPPCRVFNICIVLADP